MLDNDKLLSIRNRVDKLGASSWKLAEVSDVRFEIIERNESNKEVALIYNKEAANFIANSRDDILTLLAEIDRLNAKGARFNE